LRQTIISRHDLSVGQLRQLDERIEQLLEASRHLGRKDWLLLFLGAMFSLVAGAVIPADAVSQLVETVMHGLDALYGPEDPLLPKP
jgi:hypothetical protein